MDYWVETEEFSMFIETEKNHIKDNVLKQYIALRKAKGLTQEEIANRTGIKRTNIVRVESGKYVPTIEMLVKLATALDMELEVKMVPRKADYKNENSKYTATK